MQPQRFATEPAVIRLPQPPVPVMAPGAFMMCPVNLLSGPAREQWLCQQWIYQQAFARAQAVAQPSLPERDLLAVWN